MFFRTRNGGVYHVLDDEVNGAAPCGAKLTGYELYQLRQGTPTKQLSEKKPDEVPLCKQCEKREEV
jgi:hypothetical protein